MNEFDTEKFHLRAKVKELGFWHRNQAETINAQTQNIKDLEDQNDLMANTIESLQTNNDLQAKTIIRLSQERATLKDAHDYFKSEYQKLVSFYDKHVGTPCEQIHHEQEMESLKENNTLLLNTIEKLHFDIVKRGGLPKIDDNNAKALLYDLDQMGIDSRTKDAAELVDARAQIVTLKELNLSGKWRMEQVAVFYLQQDKELASLRTKLRDTERDHQQAIYALGQSEDAYLKLETEMNKLKAEVTSLRAKLDGEPCNLDFQKEAAKMSAYADKCLTIKEEAMGHAAAMSKDVTALGERVELLLVELERVGKALNTYRKLYADEYLEVAKKNERIKILEDRILSLRIELVNEDRPAIQREVEWP